MAIATSALEIRSPEVSSMSSSRAGGDGDTCCARSISSSVVSPIAETTTTTSLPSLRVATIRSATRLMRSAVPTDEPPYFWTTRPTAVPAFDSVPRHALPGHIRTSDYPPGPDAPAEPDGATPPRQGLPDDLV